MTGLRKSCTHIATWNTPFLLHVCVVTTLYCNVQYDIKSLKITKVYTYWVTYILILKKKNITTIIIETPVCSSHCI